jgi:nucleoid-associated protein YgaU
MFARVAIVLLAAVVLWAVLARDTGASAGTTHYRVQPGDTLWSIALAHVGGDPREAVWRIQELNDLEGATIVPGQRLRVP